MIQEFVAHSRDFSLFSLVHWGAKAQVWLNRDFLGLMCQLWRGFLFHPPVVVFVGITFYGYDLSTIGFTPLFLT